MKPGNRWIAPHDAAVQVLAQGLRRLSACSKGSVDEVLETESYKKFYMHRTGHWLGLDVHDAGEYKRDGEWRALEPGMVLTVEPGCYIRPGDGVPRALRRTSACASRTTRSSPRAAVKSSPRTRRRPLPTSKALMRRA